MDTVAKNFTKNGLALVLEAAMLSQNTGIFSLSSSKVKRFLAWGDFTFAWKKIT